uniref:Uncharacterized protein n=1 Tax=Euplotes crassus TaxID=5936 RepID=A0A7S3KBQ8_EUPCR|mmetsp:Transcript_16655/g.16339  ORF Transcript_16655/g.16339 Transcript_16655/m.16339 type:complete len:108 (+) Transcript_16655:50-373(+)
MRKSKSIGACLALTIFKFLFSPDRLHFEYVSFKLFRILKSPSNVGSVNLEKVLVGKSQCPIHQRGCKGFQRLLAKDSEETLQKVIALQLWIYKPTIANSGGMWRSLL